MSIPSVEGVFSYVEIKSCKVTFLRANTAEKDATQLTFSFFCKKKGIRVGCLL
jgi:hypothetical protein